MRLCITIESLEMLISNLIIYFELQLMRRKWFSGLLILTLISVSPVAGLFPCSEDVITVGCVGASCVINAHNS